MTDLENFKLLGTALGIGLLIGLERGWESRDWGEGTRVAGLRTFGLIALLGGVWAFFAREVDPLLIGFSFLALTLVLMVAYHSSLERTEDFGVTSVIASLLTFAFGALAVFGYTVLASSSAVVVTFLLGFKPLLHGWLKKIERRELFATLKLLLISVVILPILPDSYLDSWQVFNPYHVWLMVVLIATISYLGYFSIKIAGNRHGPVLTGVFGGLVSSTAVTLNLARFSRQFPGDENALSAGILTACATMFPRTLFLASIINPALLKPLFPALLLMGVLSYLFAFLFWKTAANIYESDTDLKLENPFQLVTALKFGALLLAILFIARMLHIYFGDTGVYFVAAISGITDVDPITLSMSRMSQEGLAIDVAVLAILIAVAVNSVVKGIMALSIGGRTLGFRVGGAMLCSVGLGVALFFIQ